MRSRLIAAGSHKGACALTRQPDSDPGALLTAQVTP